MLVLGDSRVYSGLDPAAATASADGPAVPQRRRSRHDAALLAVLPASVDPASNRFRAIVIAVDTYADDDSAIGSLDGDDRPMDLRYVVFQTRLSDLPKLAGSFSDPRERVEHGIDLFLRGPELRDDFQAFVSDPLARLRAIEQAREQPTYDPLAAHPRSETLDGLLVNFSTGEIVYPPGISNDERAAIATQVLRVPKPEPVVRALPRAVDRADRRKLRRGGRAGDLRAHPDAAGASLGLGAAERLDRGYRAQYGARLLPARQYIALERPRAVRRRRPSQPRRQPAL